jgi:hypothetical protein
MKKAAILLLAFLAVSSNVAAQEEDPEGPVDYVRVCSLYGSGFFFIPGTEICMDPRSGDTRQATEGGVWRSRWPYPEGDWVRNTKQDCSEGEVVHIGDFHSTDFTLNQWLRKQTEPTPLNLTARYFVSRVYMSGGFYDPRLSQSRSGVNSSSGFCVRSVDPTEMELQGGDPPFEMNPPFGTGFLPIGCVANSRIKGMPATYAISATASYPSVDHYTYTAEQDVAGPYLYGSHLVVTTDLGMGGELLLTYHDESDDLDKPLAGTLSVSVCVQRGIRNLSDLDADVPSDSE